MATMPTSAGRTAPGGNPPVGWYIKANLESSTNEQKKLVLESLSEILFGLKRSKRSFHKIGEKKTKFNLRPTDCANLEKMSHFPPFESRQ